MTNEQARKLVGGYATNSLTEAERKALFEAALEDQELFDALQQEEALKELLADPESRSQIQQALNENPVLSPAATRGRRILVWGGLAGAVAAAILIIALIRPNPQPKYQVARVAPPSPVEQAKPVIVAPPAPVSVEPARPAVPAPAKSRPRKLSPLPSPSPVPSPTPAVAPQMQSFTQARATPAPSGGIAGSIAGLKAASPLQYVLVRRNFDGTYTAPLAGSLASGDAVRWKVFTAVAGFLSLYQLDESGDSKRLFPPAEPGLLMSANGSATIPDSPLIVTDKEQKFRLTLMPMDQPPLTIDLTVGPGKAP